MLGSLLFAVSYLSYMPRIHNWLYYKATKELMRASKIGWPLLNLVKNDMRKKKHVEVYKGHLSTHLLESSSWKAYALIAFRRFCALNLLLSMVSNASKCLNG